MSFAVCACQRGVSHQMTLAWACQSTSLLYGKWQMTISTFSFECWQWHQE